MTDSCAGRAASTGGLDAACERAVPERRVDSEETPKLFAEPVVCLFWIAAIWLLLGPRFGDNKNRRSSCRSCRR
jgi:hypothetical protein